MLKRMRLKEHGKLKLSLYFQEFKKGDKVALVRYRAVISNVPERMQGKTGTIAGMKGKCYIVNVKDGNAMKEYIVQPAHLKKLKQTN